MTTNWQKLMEDFDLESSVSRFVIDKVSEILGDGKHKFSFDGTPHSCGNPRPHIPHVTSQYNTVRYGWLQNFCLGKSGDNPGEPYIVIRNFDDGDAEFPGYARGYWFARKPQEEVGEGEA